MQPDTDLQAIVKPLTDYLSCGYAHMLPANTVKKVYRRLLQEGQLPPHTTLILLKAVVTVVLWKDREEITTYTDPTGQYTPDVAIMVHTMQAIERIDSLNKLNW